jgi:hypothetical protein
MYGTDSTPLARASRGSSSEIPLVDAPLDEVIRIAKLGNAPLAAEAKAGSAAARVILAQRRWHRQRKRQARLAVLSAIAASARPKGARPRRRRARPVRAGDAGRRDAADPDGHGHHVIDLALQRLVRSAGLKAVPPEFLNQPRTIETKGGDFGWFKANPTRRYKVRPCTAKEVSDFHGLPPPGCEVVMLMRLFEADGKQYIRQEKCLHNIAEQIPDIDCILAALMFLAEHHVPSNARVVVELALKLAQKNGRTR